MNLSDFWNELRRRRVVRVVIGYAVAAFIVLQVAELTLEPLGLPAWTYRLVLMLTVAGFPIAVVLAWAFDVTPDGIRRAEAASPDTTGRRRVWPFATVAVAALGITAWLVFARSDDLGAEGIDPDLIAVVPFRISSADEDVAALREGILNLLAPYFSDAPRMIDVGAMVTAWRRVAASDESDISEGEAVELARSLGAGRLIVGSFVGTGERFTATARLIRVPGGSLVGDATIDGSTSDFGNLALRLSGALLALEAGVQPDRADYLGGVPNDALRAYLEGRRLFRQADYNGAREASSRALDIDSTLALAAVGLRSAANMGLDQARFAVIARADRLIRTHLDRLPPRDREFAIARFRNSEGGRRNTMESIRDLEAIATRFSDKPEAWYNLGDQVFHRAEYFVFDDAFAYARAAFDSALALDPGLLVVRQHRLWQAGMTGDTAYYRAEAPSFNAATAGTWPEIANRAIGASFGDTVDAQFVQEAVARSSSLEEAYMAFFFRAAHADEVLAALDRAAQRPSEQITAVATRLWLLRNGGRTREAEQELDRLDALAGVREYRRLLHALYWNGNVERARTAVRTLSDRLGDAGTAPWSEGGEDLCYLEVWRLNLGDTTSTRGTIERLTDGWDDPEPSHGQNALCVLLLESMLADAIGARGADERVADLKRVMDLGPFGQRAREVANMELAKLLEARGDFANAGDAVYSPVTDNPNYYSTMVREGARLADLAGDVDQALEWYREFLELFAAADPEFSDLVEGVRTRVAELETQLAER